MKRQPQKVCKCGHARSQHDNFVIIENHYMQVPERYRCGFCFDKCPEFKMDNLATLERLSKFYEEKEASQ